MPDREFKVMVIKILIALEKKSGGPQWDLQQKKYKKESNMKNAIAEI